MPSKPYCEKLHHAALKVVQPRKELWWARLDVNGDDIYHDPIANRLYERFQHALGVAIKERDKSRRGES